MNITWRNKIIVDVPRRNNIRVDVPRRNYIRVDITRSSLKTTYSFIKLDICIHMRLIIDTI